MEEMRTYNLAVEQRLDPIRAVIADRAIAKITDPERRARQRRHLLGVILPFDSDNEDDQSFMTLSKSHTDRFDASQKHGESITERWFESPAGRKFRFLDFVHGADDLLIEISERGSENFSGCAAGPDDLIAITTDGQYWKLSDVATLPVIIEAIQTVACDFDVNKNTELGPCLETHQTLLDGIAKCDGIDSDGVPDMLRRTYISERFFTFPIARGNTIVLARVCDLCFGAFIYANHIKTNKIGYIETSSRGFGSVGGGPIEKSEYVPTAIENNHDEAS